jgi:CheY-like chemotaxis protein
MAPVLEGVLGKRTTLMVEPELDPRYVRVDPTQLEQVIMNLVVNARDAMSGAGTLSLRVASVLLSEDDVYRRGRRLSAGAYVALSASDTGCGMSSEVQARIFEPFFTTKGLGKGTGLGLPSVYGIVQQSDGHIDVTSEVGSGTTFTILLPQVDVAPPELAAPSRLADDSCATVLVVEDQLAVRQLMARTLRRAGHQVLEAGSAEDGLEIVDRLGDSIELLVTDAVLPGHSGPTLASQALLRVPGMRVLFVSGYSDDAILRLGIVSARDAFLQKPFGPNAFARKVQEVLCAAQ